MLGWPIVTIPARPSFDPCITLERTEAPAVTYAADGAKTVWTELSAEVGAAVGLGQDPREQNAPAWARSADLRANHIACAAPGMMFRWVAISTPGTTGTPPLALHVAPPIAPSAPW